MRGTAADGMTPYAAVNDHTMLFAAVTISHAALTAYEKFAFHGWRLPHRLPDVDRDSYFRDMAELAVLMGAARQQVPVSASEVADYYRAVGDKFTTRPGFQRAQFGTALALVRPDGRADMMATLGDIALLGSATLAYAALPRPSRRLNKVPAVADPVLSAMYFAALPVFALLQIGAVQRAALRWYLGAADFAILSVARQQSTAQFG